MSALHQASLMGSTEVIKQLLEHGASADLKDNKGNTFMWWWWL
jgi:ankyrin repeat protein